MEERCQETELECTILGTLTHAIQFSSGDQESMFADILVANVLEACLGFSR